MFIKSIISILKIKSDNKPNKFLHLNIFDDKMFVLPSKRLIFTKLMEVSKQKLDILDYR